jgi:hypothetical protein
MIRLEKDILSAANEKRLFIIEDGKPDRIYDYHVANLILNKGHKDKQYGKKDGWILVIAAKGFYHVMREEAIKIAHEYFAQNEISVLNELVAISF